MKRLLSVLLVLSLAVSNLSLSTPHTPLSNRALPVGFKKIHLQGSATLSGGCTITYNLVLDVTIIPTRFNSLTGTVSFSGTCTGTQNLNISQLRGTVNEKTRETTGFQIVDNIFNNPTRQKEFELLLQKEINKNRDQIFDPSGSKDL